MAKNIRVLSVGGIPTSPTGCTQIQNNDDRINDTAFGVPYGVGGSAGASVAVAVAIQLPATYMVDTELGADATCFVTAKTTAGFTLNIQPRLASATLAAGTVNCRIRA